MVASWHVQWALQQRTHTPTQTSQAVRSCCCSPLKSDCQTLLKWHFGKHLPRARHKQQQQVTRDMRSHLRALLYIHICEYDFGCMYVRAFCAFRGSSGKATTLMTLCWWADSTSKSHYPSKTFTTEWDTRHTGQTLCSRWQLRCPCNSAQNTHATAVTAAMFDNMSANSCRPM